MTAPNALKKTAASKRLRVLLSAHEFSPARGSECAVGWNIGTRMAALHDVTVLCADGPALFENAYRNEIENHFAKYGAVPGLRVVYVAQPARALRYARINRRLMRLTRGTGWQPLYYQGLDAWHRAALQQAREMGLKNFDLVHQLTPITFRRPGYLWATGLPFFWGPTGGMYKVPWDFARLGGMSSLLFEMVRSGNITWQTRLPGRFATAVRKAKRIWTVSEDDDRAVNAVITGKTAPMLDAAPPAGLTGFVRRYDGMRPLRICWSGRHEAIKALPLLLRALALLPAREKIVLDILGRGSETQSWQLLAKQLSLTNIIWRGLLPYHEALRIMGESDVLIHTSFREAASMVVLEALGLGMPVICHDVCGMAIAIDDTCGIKVALTNPTQSIKGFRDALDNILRNPGMVEQLSRGALLRASRLDWDIKVREIADSYRRS